MNLKELTAVFLRIGMLSFGGPAAQIALMHKELVEERSWLTEQQYLRALSFCMMLPGPEAMQLATYAGWRQRGILGGFIGGGLFVLPGEMIITALALAYGAYGDLGWVQALFLGVKATVVVIVIAALRKVAGKALNGPMGDRTVAGSDEFIIDAIGQYAADGFDELIVPDFTLGATAEARREAYERFTADIIPNC